MPLYLAGCRRRDNPISINLQYFMWGADAFTEGLKEILRAKANPGVEIRPLYDPIGSQRTYRWSF